MKYHLTVTRPQSLEDAICVSATSRLTGSHPTGIQENGRLTRTEQVHLDQFCSLHLVSLVCIRNYCDLQPRIFGTATPLEDLLHSRSIVSEQRPLITSHCDTMIKVMNTVQPRIQLINTFLLKVTLQENSRKYLKQDRFSNANIFGWQCKSPNE